MCTHFSFIIAVNIVRMYTIIECDTIFKSILHILFLMPIAAYENKTVNE